MREDTRGPEQRKASETVKGRSMLHACSVCDRGRAPDSREQNIRDRNALQYGTDSQKMTLIAALAVKPPLKQCLPSLHRVLGPNASARDAKYASARLHRLVTRNATATVTSVDQLPLATTR